MKNIKHGQEVISYFFTERGITLNEATCVREEDGFNTVRLKYKNSDRSYIENVNKVFPNKKECIDHLENVLKKLNDDLKQIKFAAAKES